MKNLKNLIRIIPLLFNAKKKCLKKYLTKKGIGTGIHYPIPIHLRKHQNF